MADLYRTMRMASGCPEVGSRSNCLGVRVGGEFPDVFPDENGNIHPGDGKGLSLTPDPSTLAPHLKPKWLGGGSRFPLWKVTSTDITEPLSLRSTSSTHEIIEPAYTMHVDVFQQRLSDTRDSWKEVTSL
jgi:hypothetical protein